MAKMSLEDVKERLAEIIQEWANQSEAKPKSVELQLRIATNLLKGIDAPFFYIFFCSGVTPFR